MIPRLIISGMLLSAPLPIDGQGSAGLPASPQVPEVRSYQNGYQAVVVHSLNVDSQATLIMSGLRGDVNLQGNDNRQIIIEERITIRTRNQARAQEMVERTIGQLSPPSASGKAYVFDSGEWSDPTVSYSYDVQVPVIFNVIVNSYGGDIELYNLQGDLEARTGGGDINVSTTAGRIQMNTGGGDIDADRVQGQVDLTTGGGDIDIRSAEGRISAATGGGDIDFFSGTGNFVLNTGGGDIDLQELEGTEIEARTGGGDIDVADITAQVNLMTGGGDITGENVAGSIEAATSGGDIDMRIINGDAILFTAAGDIDIQRITGAIRANTGSGDIDVTDMRLETPDREESTFTTASGDVEVYFYSDEPIDVSARILGYPLRLAKDRINSNLDLTYQSINGNTMATYTTEQPFHIIIIETTNGEIRIMKGEQ